MTQGSPMGEVRVWVGGGLRWGRTRGHVFGVRLAAGPSLRSQEGAGGWGFRAVREGIWGVCLQCLLRLDPAAAAGGRCWGRRLRDSWVCFFSGFRGRGRFALGTDSWARVRCSLGSGTEPALAGRRRRVWFSRCARGDLGCLPSMLAPARSRCCRWGALLGAFGMDEFLRRQSAVERDFKPQWSRPAFDSIG
jgi:hypothetical protein